MEDKYKFVKVVGRGTFGCVYRAIDRETGKTVAIKKIEENYQPWMSCFNTEVKALIKFGGHPNIISLKEAMKDDSDNTMYLVFEYMPFNLYNFIKNSNHKGIFFGEKQIKKWGFQILKGLEYIHKGGYFHRDLKPQNLLVSGSGDEVKIADLGSVRLIDDKTPCREKVGTRWYQAPEVLLGSKNYGPAVDMWAVGVILAELFMGRPLFPGNSSDGDQVNKICAVIGSPTVSFADHVKKYEFRQVKSNSAEDFAVLMPSASEDAISLIKSLCSWDPFKRPSAADALQHHFFVCSDKLVQYEEEKPILRPPPPGFPLIQKKSLRPQPRVPSIPLIAPPPGFSPVPKIPAPPGLSPARKIAAPPPALPHMVIAHNGSKRY